MSDFVQRGLLQSTGLRWFVAVALTGIALMGVYTLQTRPVGGQGVIELSDLQLDVDDEALSLDANARIRLSPTLQAGLDNGVPLTFVLALDIIEVRPWWLDRIVFGFERHYTLTYYELTRHYRVSETETDISRNFRSLSSALAGLGQRLRVTIDLSAAQRAEIEQQAHVASVDMQLSTSALPLPLQPIIRSSWTLKSEEYRWPVM